ncbi:MAG: hypothetical protein Q4P79_02965 [Fusobacterium sp.]|nr:hypothetical protein [Fusobacterium sp.]MDO5788402.1 hypothetical protein [Fusobacterium sp.]
MKAYNCRKLPREIYLFRKKGKKLSLTKIRTFLSIEGFQKWRVHCNFKIIKRDKIQYVKCNYTQKFAFEKQLMKILSNKPKEVSISSMIAIFKGLNDGGTYSIDFTKVQRKDFVSRDLKKIINLLKEKNALISNSNS